MTSFWHVSTSFPATSNASFPAKIDLDGEMSSEKLLTSKCINSGSSSSSSQAPSFRYACGWGCCSWCFSTTGQGDFVETQVVFDGTTTSCVNGDCTVPPSSLRCRATTTLGKRDREFMDPIPTGSVCRTVNHSLHDLWLPQSNASQQGSPGNPRRIHHQLTSRSQL